MSASSLTLGLPLEGIKVVELSTMITASFAAMMLAEQGAQVVKVEPIEQGDPMRYIGSAKGGSSGLFANCNRGKQSIRVNLKESAGADLVKQLALEADVLIHNFRPGVMDNLGLGSEALRAAHPKLVYAAVSGFGTEGPLRRAPAYDPVVQARCGLTASQGASGDPAFVRNLMCDKITAYTACQAVTAALFQRERAGVGQHIDLSMLDAGLFFLYPDGFMNHTLLDEDVVQQPLLSDLVYQPTATKDGYITISASTPGHRAGVHRALNRDDLNSDPRFATMDKLVANLEVYQGEMAEAFTRFTSVELVARLADNDVPCANFSSLEEVINDPQIEACGTLATVEHSQLGNMRIVRNPAKFGGERLPIGASSPAHGEHTEAVLAAIGVDASALAALRADGVVA